MSTQPTTAEPEKITATVQTITLSVTGIGPVPEMKDKPEIIGGKPTGRTLTEPTGRMVPGLKHIAVSAHDLEGVLAALDDHDHEHASAVHNLLDSLNSDAAFLLEHFEDAHKLTFGINRVEAVPEIKNGKETGLMLVGDRAVLPKDVEQAVDDLEESLHDEAVAAALPPK